MLRPVQAQADTQLDQVKKNKKNKGNRHVQCRLSQKRSKTVSVPGDGTDFLTAIELQ